MKIAFVILHYENIQDTENCVFSILNLYHEKIKLKIFLVDNNSPNNSGYILKSKYEKDDSIEVIPLNENLGFSKANNIGYQKAKEWGADIILVSNNDILIEDKNFMSKLLDIFESNKNNYAIIAPDIINAKKFHQNPLRNDAFTLKKSYKNLIYNSILLFFMKIPIVNNIVFKLEKKRNEKWFENYYAQQKNDKISDIVPHGAFLIFFPAWIVNEEIAFPSNTFMYLEEDFLKKYCDRLKYKIIYIPELKVKHLEGRSVSAISKKELIKYQFKLKNVTISLKKYIKFLKEKR